MYSFLSKVSVNSTCVFLYWLTFKSPTEKFNCQRGKSRVYHDLFLTKHDVCLFMWWFEAPSLFHVPRWQSCVGCQKKASISFQLQWLDFAPSTILFHPPLLTFEAKFSSVFPPIQLANVSLPHLLFNSYILIQVNAFIIWEPITNPTPSH